MDAETLGTILCFISLLFVWMIITAWIIDTLAKRLKEATKTIEKMERRLKLLEKLQDIPDAPDIVGFRLPGAIATKKEK